MTLTDAEKKRIVLYARGKATPVSDHFKSKEFDCPCGCAPTRIDTLLVGQLELIRSIVLRPVVITSAYRCPEYQDDLRKRGYETAVGVSTHNLGMAADLTVAGMTGQELLAAARRAGFICVGVGNFWIHVDTRLDKKREWGYLKR